jgi:DNA-binding NarL/FixJ family response regulator
MHEERNSEQETQNRRQAVKPIRVLLVDDHTLFRAGIRRLLEDIAGVKVVAEASTGREALHLTKTTRPDVVLMDITMKDLNGLEATTYIAQEYPQVRVFMLSMHDSEQYVTQALRAGARGYVLKDAVPTELALAVQAVARGEMYLSAAVSKPVITDYLRHLERGSEDADRGTESAALLTPRQREILQLIVEGRTTKEIAVLLQLSINTVATHRKQLMARLAARDVAGLVRAALRLGIVPPNY